MNPDDRLTAGRARLAELGYLTGDSRLEILAGDGSDRLFIRISSPEQSPRLAVLPAGPGKIEARAARLIGSHLAGHDIPVPAIIDFDEPSGVILFEDLGDTLLHDLVVKETERHSPSPRLRGLYGQAVEALARMQVVGRQGFDPAWCWDTPCYDRQLMLTREADYFLTACCLKLLGLKPAVEKLQKEFQKLAARAAREPADFFLHRDFQSRNLMVKEGRVRIIDFQGARLGPLGYDLASLLIDPYAALAPDFQAELLEHYLQALSRFTAINRATFLQGYYYLALQRNLQILGAFAFLSGQRGKNFFRTYLKPAAATLQEHLAKPEGADYPCLRDLAAICLDRLAKIIK